MDMKTSAPLVYSDAPRDPPGRRRQSRPRLQGGRRRRCSSAARPAPRIEDVDGNRYIDYVMSWGPLIHGHAPRGLVKALAAAARLGTSFGAPSPLEVELGERVRALMPSIERVRFVSSGTEAAMSARPRRAGRHRPRPDRQVRRLLSRPRRPVPGQGGLRRDDAGVADEPGRHARPRRPTRWSRATTISIPSSGSSTRIATRSRRSSSSRSPATWDSSRRPTDFCRAARDLRRARRAADFRRSDLRISSRARRRAGAVRRRPDLTCSARSSAAACRSARTAAART